MFLDSEIRFSGSSGWSPTTHATTQISPTVWDSGPLGVPAGGGGTANAGRDLGVGSEMWLEILVTAAVTSSSTANVQFSLVTDSTVAITTVNYLVLSANYSKTALTAGKLIRLQAPAFDSGGLTPWKRYVAAAVDIATTDLSAGTFDIKFVKNIQQADMYTPGFVVN